MKDLNNNVGTVICMINDISASWIMVKESYEQVFNLINKATINITK